MSIPLALFGSLAVSTVAAEQLISEGFEGGLGAWAKNGNVGSSKISVISEGCPSGNRCLQIEKEKRRGFTYIGRTFRAPSAGSLVVRGLVKVPSLTTGANEWDIAKFGAVVYEDGKEVAWPNADIPTPLSEWVPREFSVYDLSAGEKVTIRIGLQEAKGVIQVDDVSLSFEPD